MQQLINRMRKKRKFQNRRFKNPQFNTRSGGQFTKGPSGPVLGRRQFAELGFINVADVDNVAVAAGTIIPLNLLAQGDSQASRHGNWIMLKRMTGYITVSHATSDAQHVRFVIFSDEDSRGAAPAVTDVLEDAEVTSPFARATRERFTIWKDKIYSTDANGPGVVSEKFFINFQNMICRYASSGGLQANLFGNAVYALWITDVAANGPVVSLGTQARFTDR